jgi:hypothetical protein
MEGTLEWASAASGEPFIVIRGDDGRLYYVDTGSAQRSVPGALTGGTRVAILGIEGAKAHEVTALAIGTGSAAALARAVTSAKTTSSPAVASPPATAPSSPAPGVSASPVTPLPSPAPVSAPPAVGPLPLPATASAPPAVGAPPSPAPAPASALPAVTPPPSPGAASAAPPVAPPSSPATPSALTAIGPLSGGVSSQTAAPKADVRPADAPERQRWTEVRGIVRAVSRDILVLRVDDGQLVAVDTSELNANLADTVTPGMTVSVYGDQVDSTLRIRGLMHSDGPAAAPKRPASEAQGGKRAR